MPQRKASIRFWQTGLFIVVIVVAMLILSGSLSAGLQATLTGMGKANEVRNASALVRRLEPDFPVTAESRERMRQVLIEYRSIYGAGIWVYDRTGTLVESSYDTAPSDTALAEARDTALADISPYATMDLRPNGWVIAARTILDPTGAREGVVVTASPVDDSLRILDAVRDRLWVTFWISLVVAGLLGFAFSDLIRRRIRRMLDVAAAIAEGDFEQRVPTGLVPDEVQDLALAYNRMAVKLGEAFGAIEESRRQIAAVVDSMAEGVVAFDSAGVVRVINPEATHLLGLPNREVLGSPAEEVTVEAEVLEVVRAGLVGQSTARIVHLDQLTVLLNCTTLFDAEGEVDGAVLLLTDVTEQRRIEAAQRRFVADASHEMRTPIAALKGILELLADGAKDDPEVRDDFIVTMQVEADRLGRLVIDLLTLAQLDAGSLRLSQAPEWVTDLVGDVARVMHTLAEQADVVLAVEPPADDVQVIADRDRVVQVLLSFTDNALKHSGAGTTVHLRARRTEGGVVFEVADEGPGIETEQLSRVFERFYRANAARPGTGGTGLGLAIAKEIVEAHGSSIEVHSVPGEGTTFGFELPVA
ncbi:MAG: PAS domain-containing protein [Coriobacteriia bacterium]|nr:PAS domain-containing protein [Coriobacteriia bacterium]